MKRLNLRQGLLFMALFPSTVISVLLVAYFTFSGMRSLETELHNSGLATVRYLAPISEYGIIAGQTEGLYSLVQATLQQPGIKAAIVVNKKGRAIAVSGRVSLAADVIQLNLKDARLVADSEHWIAYGAPVLRSTSELDPIFETTPTEQSEAREIIGHVFVELDKSALRQAQSNILQRSLALIGIGLILIYILAIGMADNLARPILRLVNAVRKMTSGAFDTRIKQDSPGEVGELEIGFNEMATHIEGVQLSMQERIEEATAQLAFQARHDGLTGLINRREFETRLSKTLEIIQMSGEETSFLFIDHDRFKPVNDICGHLAGDELLRQMALLLQGRLREGDTLARLGGDEFGILLANCSGAAALQVANDICGLTSAFRFIWQDKVFAVGASIGLTTINPRVRNINEILGAADAACYHAKESGRNQVAEQEIATTVERRQESGGWQERILSAINEGRLLVDAQPLCALLPESPPIERVELAARLSEPGQTSVSLTALIDAAERYELAPRIDQLLLEKAISTLARIRESGRTLHCFVPVSASSLCQPATISFIASLLARENIGGEGLFLVFSEDTANRHIGQAVQFSRELKTLGGQIAIEEFGGGMASFGNLRTLSPQYIKLGNSLTRELGGNRASTALLRAVVEIADDLDIITIADHIENPQQFTILSELQVDCAKGFAVGPTEPLDSWLEGIMVRGKI